MTARRARTRALVSAVQLRGPNCTEEVASRAGRAAGGNRRIAKTARPGLASHGLAVGVRNAARTPRSGRRDVRPRRRSRSAGVGVLDVADHRAGRRWGRAAAVDRRTARLACPASSCGSRARSSLSGLAYAGLVDGRAFIRGGEMASEHGSDGTDLVRRLSGRAHWVGVIAASRTAGMWGTSRATVVNECTTTGLLAAAR
jgi:hypothetical protein